MSITDISNRAKERGANLDHYEERVELAACFRWTARLNMHEAVANHFSLSVDDEGKKFLMNPDQMHFSLIRASDLLLLDADDEKTMNRPDAPDPTAWGLHGALHRNCAHARCAMHVHSIHATVLATLADPHLPAIDQNSAMFFDRVAVEPDFGGLALDEEAERACARLADPKYKVLIMANHGVFVVGDSPADAFNRLFYFERAAETYVKALWTGRELRVIPDEIAEKTAREIEQYPGQARKHMDAILAMLDRDGEDFRH